jgi:hypothetical protein
LLSSKLRVVVLLLLLLGVSMLLLLRPIYTGSDGGLSAAMAPDARAQAVLDKSLPLLHAQLPSLVGQSCTLLSYATQVVAGTNYFLKLQSEHGDLLHVRIYEDFQGNVQLTDLQAA